MCGIAGMLKLNSKAYPGLRRHLAAMNKLQAHRGPDGEGVWAHPHMHLGFGHRRLAIIDLKTGAQPMADNDGNVICYNGEIYNYVELRQALKEYSFRTTSDTEVVLKAYKKWGKACVDRFRGMFAFAIWDESKNELFCARDRFGIKPFYYTVAGGTLYFASEAKALVPFLKELETDMDAMKDYLAFQFCLEGKTLFKDVRELLPAHHMTVRDGRISLKRYWEVYYRLDFDHKPAYFRDKLKALIQDSVRLHVRSDVPVGAYVSGGSDSGIIASLASDILKGEKLKAFNGKFSCGHLYDESRHARALARMKGMALSEIEVTSRDFISSIRKIIYHLDYPVAGPGSFPQYIVSRFASRHRKVVLGGQGGDEIFGGYTRYLMAYFEQCIKGAIEGTLHSGNFIVTYESIIPNLVSLQNYKPLLQEFWKEGVFEDLDRRYFRLINRSRSMEKEINWDELGNYSPYETFKRIFDGKNVGKESYFDKMTHFDFKTLLPALLHLEDRVSMAHGLESRVPFLDHPIVEFAATMPSNIKFKDGTMKKILREAMGYALPESILNRKDKMGFPVPLGEWLKKEIRGFVRDIFHTQKSKKRGCFNSEEIIDGISKENRFGRKIWGLLSLELWHQEFIDKQAEYRALISDGK